MKIHITPEQLFANTTVDVEPVRRYLRTDPGCLCAVLDAGATSYGYDAANHIDYIIFQLRYYVAGYHQTLYQVFSGVQTLLAFDENLARRCIPLMMRQVKEELLANEWFEMMLRYENAQRQMKRKFSL